ncbi:hypothetical protein [Archangium sp.]|uniref:hypothetical protein n=1 Tax=Archangium sp. TaxID=1872627 RepID=UPI002869F593|nr:hypothetical protein [Archangium sp.]
MTKITSSPTAGILPGSPCVPSPTPTPSQPTSPTQPLPGGVLGGLKEALNQKNSQDVANAQANQLEQIQRGVQNGSISSQESAKLLEQQAKIAETIKQAQSDGFMSSSERADIKRQQMMAGFGVAQASSNYEIGSLLSRNQELSSRQAEQIGSIAQGVRSGNLSGAESSSLLSGQANIARSLANAQADGRVNLGEMVGTYLQQQSAGKDIQREKGDLEKAPHAGGLKEALNQKNSQAVANAQASQLQQIQSGVQRGSISSTEATKLLEQQAKIADAIKAAQADGNMTASERANIQRMQGQAGSSVSQASRSFDIKHLMSGNRELNARLAEQVGSIAQGIRSGTLTGGEASTLLKNQASIAGTLARAQADGRLSLGEMVNTYLQQQSAGKDIQREKSDLERAPHGRPGIPLPMPRPLPIDPIGNQKRSAEVANAQASQLEQIQQGMTNATISTDEASKLLEQQAKIAEAVKTASADGNMTPAELEGIKKMQSEAGTAITQANSGYEMDHLMSRNREASEKQAAQLGSIAQGVRAGTLTGGEASTLLKTQTEVSQSLSSAQSDGMVRLAELEKISGKQDTAGKGIDTEKSDLEKAAHARRRLPTTF